MRIRPDAALIACGLVLGALSADALGQARYPRWHDSLTVAAAKAAESGKPLFIVFRCVR